MHVFFQVNIKFMENWGKNGKYYCTIFKLNITLKFTFYEYFSIFNEKKKKL